LRPVPSPLDPLQSLQKLFTPPSSPSEFVDRWVEATTWWVEPVTRSSAVLRERMAPERLLAELIDGLLGRFGGQRLELVLRGHPVRGMLESLRVAHGDRELTVVADLADVEWDGPRLTQLQARARGVRISPGRPAAVGVAGVEVQGRTDLERIVRWADGRTGPWALEVDGDGRLHAVRDDRPLRLTGDPAYVDGALELELRAVRWRTIEVRIPRWLRLRQAQPLPELPEGMQVLDAHRVDGEVSFRLGLAAMSAPLDLNGLRDAIVRGSAVPLG
jgi:hypothetical protein